jgi:hypothetical protein
MTILIACAFALEWASTQQTEPGHAVIHPAEIGGRTGSRIIWVLARILLLISSAQIVSAKAGGNWQQINLRL